MPTAARWAGPGRARARSRRVASRARPTTSPTPSTARATSVSPTSVPITSAPRPASRRGVVQVHPEHSGLRTDHGLDRHRQRRRPGRVGHLRTERQRAGQPGRRRHPGRHGSSVGLHRWPLAPRHHHRGPYGQRPDPLPRRRRAIVQQQRRPDRVAHQHLWHHAGHRRAGLLADADRRPPGRLRSARGAEQHPGHGALRVGSAGDCGHSCCRPGRWCRCRCGTQGCSEPCGCASQWRGRGAQLRSHAVTCNRHGGGCQPHRRHQRGQCPARRRVRAGAGSAQPERRSSSALAPAQPGLASV